MADGANTLERANATAGASEDDVPINWTGVVSIVVSCSLRLHMVEFLAKNTTLRVLYLTIVYFTITY